ncbi:SDH family Clp fold serine proteinase [Hallerella succinigenes]|uniref:Serine dehydrogenase proteinase n=1 Tax=Hallerella succinigenes TaxID=1896222 RepID=A0A2M9A7M2_9BACT|nr:ATP-dependent Clp protease proteolytic subunit [Hallerella succinigenes]PJJ41715.1 serine dehydrogenase proteinase [Hallerella succinigenes]
MPNWNDVLTEIQNCGRTNALDFIRRSHLKEFSDYRKRNTIAYYSGWLQKNGNAKSSINDDDKNGFMATIHKMDRSLGLDLILHTPGGDIAATESIIDYLQRMFKGNIQAFIPQLAMSAGTMIACSTQCIYMGKESSIGPIDPQFGGIPCHSILKEFEDAIAEIKRDPGSLPAWQCILSKYHPTLLGECKKAIELSSEIVLKQLESVMFAGDEDGRQKAENVINKLNEHESTKIHARHLSIDDAKGCGLKICDLENDPKLQDLLLTVHHCYMHTFANSTAVKIVENQKGVAVVTMAGIPQ